MNSAISVNPDLLGGTPVFSGTRVPVKILFEYLEDGMSVSEFIEQYPSVSKEQAVAVIEEAAVFINAV
ncbi:MAG: DUF433 domain-containing protein [Planctomycetota bacterium]